MTTPSKHWFRVSTDARDERSRAEAARLDNDRRAQRGLPTYGIPNVGLAETMRAGPVRVMKPNE